MWPYLVRLFTDETRFVGFFRAAVLGAAMVIATGQIAAVPTWVAIPIIVLGGIIRSSSSEFVPVTPAPLPAEKKESVNG